MPDPRLYLQAFAAAAVISMTCMLVTARLLRPDRATWRGSYGVLGMGLGLAAGYWMLSQRMAWPVNALDRFLLLVLPATLVIECIAAWPRVPASVAWSLRMTLAAVIPRVLLHGSVYLSGSGGEQSWWQAGALWVASSGLLAGVWVLLAWLSQRGPGVSIPVALGLTTQSAGLTVMMAGYIKGGAAAFPLAASLLGMAAAVWFLRPRAHDSSNLHAAAGASDAARDCMPTRTITPAEMYVPAILGIGVVGLFGVLFIGRFFGRLSTGCGLAMLLAPLLGWVTELPLIRDRGPWVIGAVRLALVAILLAVILTLAKRDFDREMAPLLTQVFSSSGARSAMSLAMRLAK